MTRNGVQYLLICNTSDGLVAQLNGVIVQMQFARRLSLRPIVYLHRRSYMFGGPNPYFDADHGPNTWDFYFEPVGVPEQVLRTLIGEGRVFTLSCASELERLYRWKPESWFMNPYGYYRTVENRADGSYPTDWWQAQREKVRPFLKDGTLRFGPSLLSEVDRFVGAKFGETTLGLQLRGSDKFDFGVGPNLSRKVLPEEYFPHIDAYLVEHPECDRIFVATDQRQWLGVLEEAYPDKVISYSEKSLSDTDSNPFHDAQEKAVRGKEVLIDLLLLSRCNFLLKCHAAVGEMALVLNPDLAFLDLNYAKQPMRVKRRSLHGIAAPAIRVICAIWKWRAERGSALERVVSIEGDDIFVGKGRGRSLNVKSGASEKAARAPVLSRRFVSDGFDWILRQLERRCFDYEPQAHPTPTSDQN